MKLELKHLANAMVNNQKVFYFDDERELSHICKIVELREDELTITNGEYQYDVFFDEIKIISRPPSDLTREIEHNGEKFVPLDWFNHRSAADYFDGNIWVSFLFEDHKCNDLDLLPYGMIQKLLEWHFDIYGLIESGVAVDINNLKTQEL